MQRYFAKEKINQTMFLNPDDLYHITIVMRMKTGDLIEVVDQHLVYLCQLKVSEYQVDITILELLPQINHSQIDITLVIPILKEPKMDLILQKSTELGVSKIMPTIMSRSIVKVDLKGDKKLDRWRRICKEASEQSMRNDIPVVTEIKELKDLKDLAGIKIICSTLEKANNIRLFLQNQPKYDKIIIVIGPEGGLSIKEEELLIKMDFIPVSLGHRILRVETVPMFILSILNYEYME